MTNRPTAKTEAGLRLKTVRESIGVKQDDLAKIVKKNLRTIVRWEAGEASPSEGDWTLMAAHLQVSPAWLISGEGPRNLDPTPTHTSSRLEMLRQAIEQEETHPTYGVDWADVIRAHDEVMAYIEMSEAFSGQTSEARERRSEATRLLYHYIRTHDGQTPSLKEMNAIMREV